MAGDPIMPLIESLKPMGGSAHIADVSGPLAMLAAAMGARPKAKPGDDPVVRRPDLIPIPPGVANLNQAFPQQQQQAQINLGIPNKGTGQGSSPLPNGVQGTILAMQQDHPMMGSMLAMQQGPPMVGLLPIVGQLSDRMGQAGESITSFRRLFADGSGSNEDGKDPCDHDNLMKRLGDLLNLRNQYMANEQFIGVDIVNNELADLAEQCLDLRKLADSMTSALAGADEVPDWVHAVETIMKERDCDRRVKEVEYILTRIKESPDQKSIWGEMCNIVTHWLSDPKKYFCVYWQEADLLTFEDESMVPGYMKPLVRASNERRRHESQIDSLKSACTAAGNGTLIPEEIPALIAVFSSFVADLKADREVSNRQLR